MNCPKCTLLFQRGFGAWGFAFDLRILGRTHHLIDPASPTALSKHVFTTLVHRLQRRIGLTSLLSTLSVAAGHKASHAGTVRVVKTVFYANARQHGAGTNMAAEQQKGQALPSLPQPASKGAIHYVEKENIDPFLDQHKAAGPGLYGVPPTKQQFGPKLAGNTRKPLQDITALILAQQEARLDCLGPAFSALGCAATAAAFVNNSCCDIASQRVLPAPADCCPLLSKLCVTLLQGGLPPKQQQQAGAGAQVSHQPTLAYCCCGMHCGPACMRITNMKLFLMMV